METRIPTSDLELYPEFANVKIEEKIHLGKLEGYGDISSKPDLALIDNAHLIDWKTSMRKKSAKLQAHIYGEKEDPESAYTLRRYYAQVQSYARGLNLNGTPIDGCSLVFINRDGTYEPDIWTWTFEYNEAFANSIWSRLERIWNELQEEKDLEDFSREEFCFNCRVLDA